MDIQHRPLLVTADPLLLDDLLGLAAAASTEVTVVHTLDRALSLWPHSPLVVVGADLRPALRTADPPPGRHVFVARTGEDASPSAEGTGPHSTARGSRPTGEAGQPSAAGTYPYPVEDAPRPVHENTPPTGTGFPANTREACWSRTEDTSPAGAGTTTFGADPPPSTTRSRHGSAAREPRLLLLPRDESALVDLLTRAAAPARAPAPTVSVVGGRGGAGASILAVALALAGARAGRSTVLLDADPFGCGPDIYLGCDREISADPERWTGWDDLLLRRGRVLWRDLRTGLPGTPGVSVLTWTRGRGPVEPLPVGAVRAVLSSARDGTDLVVADLPRSFDPATTAFLNRSDLVFVVVPADVHSVVAATRVVSRLREEAPVVRVVVRGARGELSANVVSATLGVGIGADLPPEPGLARLLASGDVPAQHPRSPLARFSDSVVAGLASPEKTR